MGETRRFMVVASNPGRLDGKLLIDHPRSEPLGIPVSADGVREIWEAFVVPDQLKGTAQSVEMRRLMGILRSVYAALSTSPDGEPNLTQVAA
jgi:hypothetical protein